MNAYRLFIFFIMTVIISVIADGMALAESEEVITNSVVVEMVKAGFGEAIIIKKIRGLEKKFDLSISSLIKLKKAGVNDNIINTMIDAQSPSLSRLAGGGLPLVGDVFIMENGKFIEMEYVAGFIKDKTFSTLVPNFSHKRKLLVIVHEKQARMRTMSRSPIFYIRIHPSEIGIARFDFDTYKRKPVRYVKAIGELNSTQLNIPEKFNIDFDYKKRANGLYKITLKPPLSPGEYGIITPGGAAGSKVYDFGVE